MTEVNEPWSDVLRRVSIAFISRVYVSLRLFWDEKLENVCI
jgi:hypothetical protein